MQITAARIGAEFPAIDASECHSIGRYVMIKVAASMQALGEVVADRRLQQDMRDTALRKIKRYMTYEVFRITERDGTCRILERSGQC
jgi:hypothetical protein